MSREKIVPLWSSTLGRLIDEGAVVVAQCSRCGVADPVDLVKLAAKKGRLFSLWNRHPPCPRKCRSTITFVARRPDTGAWQTMLKTDDPNATGDLHKIAAAVDAAARAEAEAWRWLKKHHRARLEARAKARDLVARYGPDAFRQAEEGLRLSYSEQDLQRNVAVYREVDRRLKGAKPPREDLNDAI